MNVEGYCKISKENVVFTQRKAVFQHYDKPKHCQEKNVLEEINGKVLC